MGFNLIYWTPMGGYFFFVGSYLEKYGKFWKNGCFSGRIWPDWGNTAWADMAGLGSIGCNSWLCDNRPPSGWLRGAKPLGPVLGPLTSFPVGHARGVRGPGSTVPSSASLVVVWQQNGRTVRSGLSCLITLC